jgi:hypothetical protein
MKTSPRFVLVAVLLGASSLVLANPGQGKGKGKGHSPDFVPPGQVGRDVPPGHRRAPIETVVKMAPPPLRREVIAVRPSPHHVWVAGYWMWEAGAYVWMPGAWIAPPEPAAVWVAPRYETRSGVSVFISGYWRL